MGSPAVWAVTNPVQGGAPETFLHRCTFAVLTQKGRDFLRSSVFSSLVLASEGVVWQSCSHQVVALVVLKVRAQAPVVTGPHYATGVGLAEEER